MADDWPYEYGSDLHWLWGWGQRIESILASDNPVSKYDALVFRPDALARNAMMRFSINYPHVVKQIDDYLDFTEKRFEAFLDNPENDANFAGAMQSLAERIKVAAETIAENEQRSAASKSPRLFITSSPHAAVAHFGGSFGPSSWAAVASTKQARNAQPESSQPPAMPLDSIDGWRRYLRPTISNTRQAFAGRIAVTAAQLRQRGLDAVGEDIVVREAIGNFAEPLIESAVERITRATGPVPLRQVEASLRAAIHAEIEGLG